MKYPSLYNAFNKYIKLNKQEYLDLEDKLLLKKLSKKEYLIRQGEVINYLPFIKSGLMINYRLDDEGEKHVIQIRWTGLWLGDLYSFFSNSPTQFNILTYQPTELLLINHEAFNYITEKHPVYEKFFRLSIQNAYIETLNQIFNFHSSSATDRYQNLIENVPELFDHIPHYLIASFLGIKPQSLSRIRRSKKK